MWRSWLATILTVLNVFDSRWQHESSWWHQYPRWQVLPRRRWLCACRPGVLPPFRKTRYHLNKFAGRNYPRTPQELFNLRHSRLRVTIERAFEALKNRFKILGQKPFHTFPTRVKLVLACCTLHNWILERGCDELMPEEEDVTPDDVVNSSHDVEAFDHEAWKSKRMERAQAMWDKRGQTRI